MTIYWLDGIGLSTAKIFQFKKQKPKEHHVSELNISVSYCFHEYGLV